MMSWKKGRAGQKRRSAGRKSHKEKGLRAARVHARARVSVVRVCAAVRARDAPRATLVRVVAVACAQSVLRVHVRTPSGETVTQRAQCAALSTLFPKCCGTLDPNHATPTLGCLRRGIPRLASPPLRLLKQTLRALPAILLIAPLERHY